MKKKAIIIGAGPAGLTAAYELLKNTDIIPVIYEQENYTGGISRTYDHQGKKMDMGGHRFFSKSDRVMNWWLDIFPIQGAPSVDDILLKREIPLSKKENAPDPQKTDKVMLIRSRVSRIFFLQSFFDYPISLNLKTILNLGFFRTAKMGFSYLKTVIMPKRKETSLEDFFINRFGRELYNTFFKDYTKKVWGVPCDKIPADWGAQRVKGISISQILISKAKELFKKKDSSIYQKEKETSLIEQFIYPKFGPGQLWQEVADKIVRMGGVIHFNKKVSSVNLKNGTVESVTVSGGGADETIEGDYFFSTMPVKELVLNLKGGEIPKEVKETADGLMYRDFRTAGLLLKDLKIKNKTKIPTVNNIVPDTWIYIQEKEVKIGRLQIFNNWSPYMLEDFDKSTWIGLEYFCNEGDEIWNMTEKDFIDFAAKELEKINIIDIADIKDRCSVKVRKAYPAYFGTYKNLDLVKGYLNKFENLFLIGRNGQHKYNNMDHSMLSAMMAVENIINNVKTKDNIWDVNTESSYHEAKSK